MVIGGDPAHQVKEQNVKSCVSCRPLPLALAAHPEEHSSTGGDREVQEELIKMLRVGVSREQSKERLREDVREIVQEEAERLKRATEDVSPPAIISMNAQLKKENMLLCRLHQNFA